MNRPLLIASLVVLGPLASCTTDAIERTAVSAAPLTIGAPGDVVQDGSFESEISSTLESPWQGDATIEIGTKAYYGSNDAILRGDSGWHPVQQWVSVKPFTHYTASAVVKSSENMNDAFFSVRGSSNFAILNQIPFNHGTTGADWKTLRFEFDTGADTSVLLYVGIWANAPGTELRVDDVWILESPSVVTNGSFEDGAQGWDGAAASIDNSQPHTGGAARALRAASGWNWTTQWPAVLPHTKYRAGAWVRTSANVNAAYFGVRGNPAASSANIINEVQFGNVPGDYQWISFDFDSSNNTSVQLYVGYWSPGAASFVMFDDISVAQTSVAKDYVCMSAPVDGTELCGVEAPIQMVGDWGTASTQVIGIAGPTPTGPWTQIGSANVYPVTPYPWDLGPQVIPHTAWGTEGDQLVSYVFSWVPASTSDAGSDPNNAWYRLPSCSSPERPIVRITAPLQTTCPCKTTTSVSGDVTLDDPGAVSAYRCVSEITGSLKVKTSSGLARVSLPELRRVAQDLIVDATPSAGSVQSQMKLDCPKLDTIGNHLDVVATTPAGKTTSIDVGLSNKTTIGGDLVVKMTGGPITLSGLSGIDALAHGLSVSLRGDTDASAFLPTLATVKGNVNISARAALTGLLPKLARVDGILSIVYPDGTAPRTTDVLSGFDALAYVGGQLTLQWTPWPSFAPSTFGQLATVGGSLSIAHTQLSNFDFGSASMAIGGLDLSYNANLQSLTSRSIRVAALGDINASFNPRLPTCRLNDFVDAQAAGGWNGNTYIDSNSDVCPP